jgi:hypothetical protein
MNQVSGLPNVTADIDSMIVEPVFTLLCPSRLG